MVTPASTVKGAAALAALAAAAALLASPPPARAQGARLHIPADADQLIVVSSPTYDAPGHLAQFRAYSRPSARAPWRLVFGPWSAETGYSGLRDSRREGDGSTPTGVFGVGATIYGNQPDPGGLHYAYHHLVCGDWWDEDPNSATYNRFVHVPCGVTPGFAARSESLWTETVAYPYLAVIRFNVGPTAAGPNAPGSGIFLHSWVGGPTAGCVALREPRLLAVLRWMRPAAHARVAIGTERELARFRLPS